MDMSAACTAPIQPPSSAADCAHPRYREYRAYRDAMTRQLVTAMSLQSWAARMDEKEFGFDCVYEVTGTTAQVGPPGWYKNRFHPGSQTPETFGPFKTKAEADAASI